MQAARKQSSLGLEELQHIITKMPLEVCCVTVVPEFGVPWREVSKAVRNGRLPMVPASVARVLCRHAAKLMHPHEIARIVARLRLKLTATQDRKWFVIDLLEPKEVNTSVGQLIQDLPYRITDALKRSRAGRTMHPRVETALLGDLLYVSAVMASDAKVGPILYIATPPGQPVALVSSLTSGLLKACVEGLGYKKYEDSQLFGRDIPSLLQIHSRNNNENVHHLPSIPDYNPVPTVSGMGIDFTNKAYDERYVNELLGPNPPMLTELIISSVKPFFDPTRLEKKINLTVNLKSEDVAKTLKAWVGRGAISPTSDFFEIFHKVKSNRIAFQDEAMDDAL